MDYNYILDREWRAITRSCDSSSDTDDERDAKNLELESSFLKAVNKMQDNSQCQIPVLPGQLSPRGQSPMNAGDGFAVPVQCNHDPPVELPDTQDAPLSAEEQAVLAERAARNEALNAELEKVLNEAPDTHQPVPEEFINILGQLNFTNQETSGNQCPPIPEPILQYDNDTPHYGFCDRQQNPEFEYRTDFKPLPHTIVPNYRPIQEQYPYAYMQAENISELPQGYGNINELCHPIMHEQDPCEGSSTSAHYMPQGNTPMSYQGIPALYQQEPHEFNTINPDHIMNHMHLNGQAAPMLQSMPMHNMQAHMHPMQPTPTLRQLLSPPKPPPVPPLPNSTEHSPPKRETPRELRNRAEKQRRDKLNQSIALLARIVPPVAAMGRKIDKTTIMKLTAHYLRAHQYVFGNSINNGRRFKVESTNAVLSLLKGFVLAVTYRGLIVVVSHNIRQLLGYSELDLIGGNVYSIIHEQDHDTFRDHIMPTSVVLGKHGELLIPDEPNGADNVAQALAREKKTFVIRFKKPVPRSEPPKYMMCHVEGSFRKADKASRYINRCCQLVRRARARGENPRSSGNDIVFIGVVRPLADTFMSESIMESFRMEYRTRHSVDGEIIQCEQRIALVTGYMTDEVSGINAMNFMHRDDVRWVIVALREMYDQHRLFGESCYRLMAKNGEFMYMRSRGRLDVDETSKIATSFVCTNTVVSEEEGKHFIDLMKKRFNILVNNGANSIFARDENEPYDKNSIPVEDPRQLEKVILHLVTNLPSPNACGENSFDVRYNHISIVPPKKERIVNAIKRIENVLHPRVTAGMEPRKESDRNEESSSSSEPVEEPENLEAHVQLQAYGMPHNTIEAFQMLENYEQSLSNTQPQSVAVDVYGYSANHWTNYVADPIPDLSYEAQPPAYSEPTQVYLQQQQQQLYNWGALPSSDNDFANQPSTSRAVTAYKTTQANSSSEEELSYAMCSSTGELFNSDNIDLNRLTPYLFELDSLSSDSTDIGSFVTHGITGETNAIPEEQDFREENQNNTVASVPELEPLVLDPTMQPPHYTSSGSTAVDAYFADKLHIQEAAAKKQEQQTRKRRRNDTGGNTSNPQNVTRNDVASAASSGSDTTRRTVIKTPKGKGVGKRTQ